MTSYQVVAARIGFTVVWVMLTLLAAVRVTSCLGQNGEGDLLDAKRRDVLKGGVGTDWLDGGVGNDKLVGGGANTFVFNNGCDKFLDFRGDVDTIAFNSALLFGTDSNAADLLALSEIMNGDAVFVMGSHQMIVQDVTELSSLRNNLIVL